MGSSGARWRIIVIYAIEILYSTAFIVWFLHPQSIMPESALSIRALPDIIASRPNDFPLPFILPAILWSIFGISALKVLSPLLRLIVPFATDAAKVLPTFIGILQSFLVMFLIALYIITSASSVDFFINLDIITYSAFGASMIHNFMLIIHLIRIISSRNDAYKEYLRLSIDTKSASRNKASLLLRAGIRKKLILSFEGLILVIVIILSVTLFGEFRKAMLNSVISNGMTIAERFSDIIKANPGLSSIEMDDNLEIAKNKNVSSELPFESITVFFREGRESSFVAKNGTREDTIGSRLPDAYSSISATEARHSSAAGTYEFIAPATLGGITIAYTVVVYTETAVYAPFVRTVVKAAFISALFLYAALFLIYSFGSSIVFPILFLKTCVSKISINLSNMIHGKSRFSGEELEFCDRINTRDEIKDLSAEFKNMTTVIKGIMPYVSSSTLKHAEHETISTSKKDLAFLFTDIRGFTSLCEGLDPVEVVAILNKYLDIQSSIILKFDGDIDKFVGDEIMAAFEGEDKELNACLASMEIREAMARQKALAKKAAEAISIGIGINSGPVVFGSIGAKERMDYTSIGDTVNLAARLEGANKAYGTKALITEAVHESIGDRFIAREIDFITVVGKKKPVKIYEILQKSEKTSNRILEIKNLFESGLAKYRERKWKEASSYFKKNSGLYSDFPSDVFIKRIESYKVSPPPKDWDGVYNLALK